MSRLYCVSAVLLLVAGALAGQSGGQEGASLRIAKKLLRAERYAEAAEEARVFLLSGPQGKPANDARAMLCQARHHLPEELPADEPIAVDGDVKRPEKVANWRPKYILTGVTEEPRGVVIIEVIIDREGCVRSARALQGPSQGLIDDALAMVSTWVFEPATLGGRPVKVHYTLTVHYGTR